MTNFENIIQARTPDELIKALFEESESGVITSIYPRYCREQDIDKCNANCKKCFREWCSMEIKEDNAEREMERRTNRGRG